MSPFRNDIQRAAKLGNLLLNRRRWAAGVNRLARWAGVEDVAVTWQLEHGMWFDNGVMSIVFEDGAADLAIDLAHVDGAEQRLERRLDVELAPGTPSPEADVTSATAAV